MKIFNPTDSHFALREVLSKFVLNEVEPQALDHDRSEKFNKDLFKKLGPMGLLGLTVPEEYGGSEMDAVAAVLVHEELSYSDPGFCLAYLAHSMLCANNLAQNGSESQKKECLPLLCSGDWIGAMAMSEPDAGTDVLGMATKAVQKDHCFFLNGRKMWITNGTVDDQGTPCDLVLVYAKEGSLEKRKSISTFIVKKGDPGFMVGQKIRDKLGMRASNTAELVFQDCKLSEDRRVGQEGDSLIHMMRNLEIERLTLAAMSVGLARRCVDVMIRYAKERESFGKPIYHWGQIQRHIGESVAELNAARALVYSVAAEMSLSRSGQRVLSDSAKLFAASVGKKIADSAIQVLGGYGYVGEYHVERLWRDAKLLEIGGGTLEAHHKNIVRDLCS